ncbi:uncharacterized protein I206_103421 [Kwoniella pini CBS 10737]|uniref:Uncharacterized protein n=1 Tax=Kwoniella pini CBS 10737 TaxID=1296096 RepID=A0A1B9I9K4_9TREE|nr:uncharacterized protein I206_01575 [Kwoniella pini CBS 10737]OCF52288.1 hypothetical protein I206_01575 [Kwoniella pini CBS 10737]
MEEESDILYGNAAGPRLEPETGGDFAYRLENSLQPRVRDPDRGITVNPHSSYYAEDGSFLLSTTVFNHFRIPFSKCEEPNSEEISFNKWPANQNERTFIDPESIMSLYQRFVSHKNPNYELSEVSWSSLRISMIAAMRVAMGTIHKAGTRSDCQIDTNSAGSEHSLAVLSRQDAETLKSMLQQIDSGGEIQWNEWDRDRIAWSSRVAFPYRTLNVENFSVVDPSVNWGATYRIDTTWGDLTEEATIQFRNHRGIHPGPIPYYRRGSVLGSPEAPSLASGTILTSPEEYMMSSPESLVDNSGQIEIAESPYVRWLSLPEEAP